MKSDCVIVIPARLRSTRLPNKALRPLAGKPMIVHVLERARAAELGPVLVATDAEAIAKVVREHGGEAVMTSPAHASGTDRIAEVAALKRWSAKQIVVNLQGDEPLAPVAGIRAVAELLRKATAPMATLATPLDSVPQWTDPNCVKVIRALNGHALYFSRAPIPHVRDSASAVETTDPCLAFPEVLRHIGIYAYRAGFLGTFVKLNRTPLECAEALEQLRALEHGYAIAVGIAPEPFPPGVDTEADVARVERLLAVRS